MGDFRRPPITVFDLTSCTLQKRVTIKLWKSKPMRIVSVTRPDIHRAADLHQRLALYRIRNKRIYYTAPTSSENHCQEKPISEDYILWVRCSVCELWLALIAPIDQQMLCQGCLPTNSFITKLEIGQVPERQAREYRRQVWSLWNAFALLTGAGICEIT